MRIWAHLQAYSNLEFSSTYSYDYLDIYFSLMSTLLAVSKMRGYPEYTLKSTYSSLFQS